MGAPHIPPLHFGLDCCSYIEFCTACPPCLFGMPPQGKHSSVPVGACLPVLVFHLFIPCSIPLWLHVLSLAWEILNSHRFTSVQIVAPIMTSAFRNPPFSALLGWDSIPQSTLVLLCLDWPASIHSTLLTPNFGVPQSPLALLSLDLALFFILRSSNTFCVLLFSTQYSPSGAPVVLVVAPVLYPNVSLPFKGLCRFAANEHLVAPLCDITNRAKQHLKVNLIRWPGTHHSQI